ncbi:MAG: S16 family serine protease [Acidimicrobiales bacterium]
MVVAGPSTWDRRTPRPAWLNLRWAVLAGILLAIGIAAIVVELPYYAIAPGTARQVNDLIAVPKDRANPPKGRVLLATVSLRRVSALEAFQGWLDRDIKVVPEDQVLGDRRRRDFSRENLELMDDSKNVAVLVALRRLGFPVNEEGKGGLVVEVRPGSPAAGRLATGEVITSVDGVPTLLKQSVVGAIRARRPGDRIRLAVTGADGVAREEQVTLGVAPGRPADLAEGFLGVVLRTKEQSFGMPFDVTIDSGSIGGPSAGLAFTLGLLDTLTAGELTGGAKVAVTGTIQIDGSVGDVGGVTQKTAAVRAAGAEYFLVPPGEFAEARARAGGRLKVRKVANLEEAIAALHDLGGDGLPPTEVPPVAG